MITFIFITLLSIVNIEKENVTTTYREDVTTIQNQINVDGEIHRQNLIKSVEDFLIEMNLDPDTIYVPFRDIK